MIVDIHVTRGNPETIICEPMLTTSLIIYVLHRFDFFTAASVELRGIEITAAPQQPLIYNQQLSKLKLFWGLTLLF